MGLATFIDIKLHATNNTLNMAETSRMSTSKYLQNTGTINLALIAVELEEARTKPAGTTIFSD